MSIKYTKIQLKRNKEDATNLDTYHPSIGEPVFSTYSTGNKLIIGDRNQDSVNEMVSDNKYFPEMVEILGLYAGNINLSQSENNNTDAQFGSIKCNNFSSSTQIELKVTGAGGLIVNNESTTINSSKFVVSSHNMYVSEKATFKETFIEYNSNEQYHIYCDNGGNLHIDSKNIIDPGSGIEWIPSLRINAVTGAVSARLMNGNLSKFVSLKIQGNFVVVSDPELS